MLHLLFVAAASAGDVRWSLDADGDGYGDPYAYTIAPEDDRPTGYVDDDTDCDDADPGVHPGATETCDAVDQDCDGLDDDGPVCPFTSAWYRGHNYLLVNATRSWPDAADVCARYGYQLTTLYSSEEDTWLDGQVDALSTLKWWIGYHDRTSEGDWEWLDGSTDIFSNWYAGEPNDGYGSGEDCGLLNRFQPALGWNDEPCDHLERFVCESGETILLFADNDGDGFGDPAGGRLRHSDVPDGWSTRGDDCDDTDPTINPAASEHWYDGVDQDCDEHSDYDADFDDHDADFAGGDDCRDGDSTVNPDAAEVCNRIDDDCDGLVDDDDPSLDPGETTPAWLDADGDGFGDPAVPVAICTIVAGTSGNDRDCDDADPAINPFATEICNTIDDDCDGYVDDDDASVDPGTYGTWYADADGDGFGDPDAATLSCDPDAGGVGVGTDCDDADPTVHPGAIEVCDGVDDDCDDLVDLADPSLDPATVPLWYVDGDGDGWGDPDRWVRDCFGPPGTVGDDTDCDDADPAVNPAATEVCDGYDDDCDALVDDDDPSLDLGTRATWHADGDADGFGHPDLARDACAPAPGEVADGADCNDTNAAVNPAASEVCNGYDDDCDGLADDGDPSVDPTSFAEWHPDLDLDGFGDASSSVAACDPPAGALADASDCDDGDAAIRPGAPELCNAYDDDCDGLVDDADPDRDAASGSAWYADADGDGFGDPSATTWSCGPDGGAVADATDCDDASSAVRPDAVEVCNTIDDDCDGLVDDADPSVDVGAATVWADADGDGFGDAAAPLGACAPAEGTADNLDDCDDGEANTYPGADELCDGADNNCNGGVDEGIVYVTWYADADGDGFGDPASSVGDCAAPSGYVRDRADCDDADAAVSPAGVEVCDGRDDDCDGVVDDGAGPTWFADADGDGFGDPLVPVAACAEPSGYVADATDCDDTVATIAPGLDEWCNALDDDCDGVVDEDAVDAPEWYPDADGDGWGVEPAEVACEPRGGFVGELGVCDDADPDVGPGAAEFPYDGVDDDCDGADLVDVDGDGFDGGGGPDCDDSDPAVYPGAPELAPGVDDDCDGVVDEGTSAGDDDGDGFTEAGGDCDDGDPAVRPGAIESCDGVDEDCDGFVDEGTECSDDDGDGWSEVAGDCDDSDLLVYPGATEVLGNGRDDDCDGVVDDAVEDPDGDGYVAAGGDCDEGDPGVHPGAPEVEDGVDNDCDGVVDEGTAAYDDDGDGWSEHDGDCDDSAAGTHPDGAEVPGDGIDNDCDGSVDEGTEATDDDGDGFSEAAGDCDDGDPAVYPGAPEALNGRDDDCDGQADEGLADLDDDGVSAELGDCDDGDGFVYPGAAEMCDGADNDCDGSVDEGCGAPDTGLAPDTGSPTKGCAGCDGAGGPGFGWLAALALVGALGRRSRCG
jgi:hypothetical protein